MMMKWIQRDGIRKSVDIDAIMCLEFVPNKEYGRPMLTVLTCDIVDTITGRPALPGDPTYIPDMDTAEVMISQPDVGKDAWRLFRIPDEILELHNYILKCKASE
jgi:hypothetical protein